MVSQTVKLRFTMMRLIFIMGCWLGSQQAAWGKQVDVVIDDTDSSIIYLPAEAWQASSNQITPGIFNSSFHNGTHPLPAPDPDDLSPVTGKGKGSGKKGGDGDGGDGDGDGDSRRALRFLRRKLANRLDQDDEGFVDQPVTVQFSFTGSAVSLFAIEPLEKSSNNNMNLTFTLDDQPYPSFTHTAGSKDDDNGGFKGNVTVFAEQNLSLAPHVLLVTVGQGSVFLFDYMVYTTTQEDDTVPTATIGGSTPTDSSTSASTSPAELQSPSPTMDPTVKRHNIATFGAAVGGSVGVLSLFAMGLAFSIIRRRRRAAKRDRLEQESLHTNASDDTPAMIGPRPFVPRYFPGTVVPADPPAYIDSMSPSLSTANHLQAPLLSSLSPEYTTVALPSTENTSYADIPPPIALDDGVVIPAIAPPPFPVAIAGPEVSSNVLPPPGLLNGEESEESEETEPLSHEEETVGVANPVTVTIPERAVLPPSPTRSRSSSHSREYFDAGS